MRLRIAELAKQKKKWTMKKVAVALEVEHQNVLYWNQGRAYPRLPDLVRLCRLLKCTLEELVEDAPIPEEEVVLESLPIRRKGHSPQIVTGYHGQIGAY